MLSIFIPPGMTKPPMKVQQGTHRADLKQSLLDRDRHCRACGRSWGEVTAIHMHEAIYSKRDVMGWKRALRGQINIEANCLLLCDECHLGLSGLRAPTREEALQILVDLHGMDVIWWAKSLPFKVNPIGAILDRLEEKE